jgi:hypothetical protein
MISTTRGLSAISGAEDRDDDSAASGQADAPSVFRRTQISLSGPPGWPGSDCWLKPLSFRW